MKQSVTIGIFFICGLVAGIIISAYFVSSRPSNIEPTVRVIEAVTDVPVVAKVDHYEESQNQQKQYLESLTKELMQLREAVQKLNTSSQEVRVVYAQKTPTSHEEVKAIDAVSSNKPVTFSDAHEHKDDDSVAKQLREKVRVLCWIMTSKNTLQSKAIHVKNSWGKRCNKILFMSDEEDPNFPAIGLGTDIGREHLTMKTMRAFDYIYKNHFDEADWFMKADDDTYVIVENLRYMLSAHAPTEPIYFGHHFKVIVKQGYFSGGAGYVMSKEALKRFAGRAPNLCATDHGAEDVEIGRCMESLKIVTGDSRDKLGRSRFHCFNPETHLHGGYPDWYLQYDKYGAHKGIESMSDYPVSFHYVSTNQMYDLEYFIYHANPYGIIDGLQDLNGPVNTTNTVITTTTTTTTKAPTTTRKPQAQQGNS